MYKKKIKFYTHFLIPYIIPPQVHNNSPLRFMIILTSNLPEELDDAALSRVQFRVEFPLPDETERFKLFGLYFQKYILDPVSSGKT